MTTNEILGANEDLLLAFRLQVRMAAPKLHRNMRRLFNDGQVPEARNNARNILIRRFGYTQSELTALRSRAAR